MIVWVLLKPSIRSDIRPLLFPVPCSLLPHQPQNQPAQQRGPTMYIIRDIFHLKFGKAREAKELLGRMRELGNEAGYPAMRCLTDFTGDAYRLVLESEFET